MKTRKITVRNFEAFKYRELYTFTARDGCIYLTKFSGYYITADQEHLLKEPYLAANLSTQLLKQNSFEITLIDVKDLPTDGVFKNEKK